MTYTPLFRIRQLAGLLESEPYIMSSDDNDDYENREDDARYARETRIKGLIALAFKRIGIAISSDDPDEMAIFYSEDDREATVQLDESEIDIDLLFRLKMTGLSDRYQVQAGRHALNIVFIVSQNLAVK